MTRKKKEIVINKRIFTVYDPIFEQKIKVFANCEYKSLVRFFIKNNIPKEEAEERHLFDNFTTSIFNDDNNYRCYIIFIKHFEWTLDDMNTLIHETTHTIINIWDNNNIKVTKETQEFFAHTIGNLFEDISRKLLSIKEK